MEERPAESAPQQFSASTNPQLPTTYRDQVFLLWNAKALLRLMAYSVIVSFFALVVLGFVFVMMLFPLAIALMRLSFVFSPIYHFVGRIMGAKGLPERLAKPPLLLTIWETIFAAVMLGIVAFLVRILFSTGFCNQNLICMFGRSLLK